MLTAGRYPDKADSAGFQSLFNDSDTINLHANIARQPGRLYRRPGRRIGRKIPAIDLVHLRKLAHVSEENGCLHDGTKRCSASFQDGFQVFENALSLLLDTAFDQLIGYGVERDLT